MLIKTLAALCTALLVAAPAIAADLPAAVKALLPAAKTEGSATLFGVNVNPDEAKQYSEAISKFYGIPIQLEFWTGLHPQKAAQMIQESKRGVPSGLDVFWTASAIGAQLDSAGLVADVDWAALGVDPKLKFGPRAMRIHDGTLSLVIYNTDLVKAADAPTSYDALLDPKWKGKIASPRTPNPFVFLTKIMSEEKATDWFTKLIREQDTKILPTFPDVGARVGAGEFAIGLAQGAFDLKKKGAPVAQAPIEPVIVTPWGAFVMKDAKHPTIAKLFGYWAATDDGQKMLDKLNTISRVDFEGSDLGKFAHGKKVEVLSYEFMEDTVKTLGPKFAAILQRR